MKAIDELPHGPDWTCLEHRVEIPGHSFSEQVEIWMRDPVECVRELMGNPNFAGHMRYAPERKRVVGKARNGRLYDEAWSGDWWWRTQVWMYTCCC